MWRNTWRNGRSDHFNQADRGRGKPRLPLALALAMCVSLVPASAAAVDPVPSFRFLVTGNGHGFQVFDINKNAIVQFLERPYRFMRPNPSNPDGEGVVRRNLAFDTYFGVNVPGASAWLGNQTPEQVGYVEQTNVIRTQYKVGSVRTESYFYAPYGYDGNAMVMLIRVTNEGSSAASVDTFALANYHMGSAPVPDSPQANGESITFNAGGQYAHETGPGGGSMVYVPIGGMSQSSCSAGAFAAVQSGSSLPDEANCNGDDRVNVLKHSLGNLAAGESKMWGVAILYADDANASASQAKWAAFANDRSAEQMLTDTLEEWNQWRRPMLSGLTNAEQRIWRQGEAVLRMGQVLEPWSESPKRKGHGMVLASLPPGGWHSGWVRDAVYALVALARTGHYEEAKKGLNFFLDAEAGKYKSFLNNVDYRITTVRYFGNGEEEADYSGHPTRNIEIDGWGLFLWAARAYVDYSGDTAWLTETTRHGDTVYDAMRSGVAEALVANLEPNGMAIADASIWEVHWGNREHFLYTTASTARGLCDMAAMSRYHGNLEDRDRYKGFSEAAVTAMRENFVDQNNVLAGSLERLARGSNYRDGAVVEAFTWHLIPDTDPIASATMNAFSFLQTPAGGYKRLEGSQDQYDTDEWIFIDLRASQAWRQVGNPAKADELLNWVTVQATVNYDLIPELYNTRSASGAIGAYSGSIPMVGYGPGVYMTSLLHRAGQPEYTDCGTVDPQIRDDAGPSLFTDGGLSADPDGGLGPSADGRTGFACACNGSGQIGMGELLLLLLAVGGVLRITRRREERVGG